MTIGDRLNDILRLEGSAILALSPMMITKLLAAALEID